MPWYFYPDERFLVKNEPETLKSGDLKNHK